MQSITPFLLILAPFAIAFFLEALVIYFFRLKSFWRSVGIAVLINFLALVVLYASSLLIAKLGYEFNDLRLPLQVVLALWWLSVITDALLLQLLSKVEKQRSFLSALLMNTVSYSFLSFFIASSH